MTKNSKKSQSFPDLAEMVTRGHEAKLPPNLLLSYYVIYMLLYSLYYSFIEDALRAMTAALPLRRLLAGRLENKFGGRFWDEGA